jgi:uncharacterized protein (DUF58 family)
MTITRVKASLNKRFDAWLNKRMPAEDNITLHRSNAFIFPSRAGGMLIITCVIMFLFGTNYQNNLILFLVYFLLSVMMTCLLLSYQNLSGIMFTATSSDDRFTHQDCAFILRIDAKPNTAQQITYTFKNSQSTMQSVVDQRQVTLFAKNTRRGWFKPGRVTIQSYYPFGLFRVWTHLDFGFNCLLYPTPLQHTLDKVVLSGKETNTKYLATKIGVDSFNTLKPFQEGESLKSIAWKQVAQGRGKFTKHFEEEEGADVYLSLSAINTGSMEEKLSMLVYQVLHYEQQGIQYALELNGEVIKLNSGVKHQRQCLRALALYGLNDA